MLSSGPWQGALTNAVVSGMVFLFLMILALISAFFNWMPLFTIIFLLLGFALIIFLIPTFLNLSREFFKNALFLLVIHITVTILAFALHYKVAGLIDPSAKVSHDFLDAVYFSITTFTTLGYGDFRPIPEIRLVTSMEALAGMISMAIGASLLWLLCNENIIPKEMAFFDGDRRH